MRVRRRRRSLAVVLARTAAIAALGGLGPCADARAAEPPDLFGAYSYSRAGGDGRHGFDVALAFPVAGLRLVVDGAAHYGSRGGLDVSDLALTAGPRIGFRAGRTRPFVQVLAGLDRETAGLRVLDASISESSTGFGLHAEGGIDLALGSRLSLRVAGGYRGRRRDGETGHGFRAGAGLAYRLGAGGGRP
jgi:hypothetical protein